MLSQMWVQEGYQRSEQLSPSVPFRCWAKLCLAACAIVLRGRSRSLLREAMLVGRLEVLVL